MGKREGLRKYKGAHRRVQKKAEYRG